MSQNSIFGGPYSLHKKATQGYESVISLCIMDSFHTSERFYKNGNIISTQMQPYRSLAESIEACIRRLEYLMQQEKYHPTESLDINALR